MKKRTALRVWLARRGHTQRNLADLAGVAQASISEMVNSARDVYVVDEGVAGVHLVELIRIPRRRRPARGPVPGD